MCLSVLLHYHIQTCDGNLEISSCSGGIACRRSTSRCSRIKFYSHPFLEIKSPSACGYYRRYPPRLDSTASENMHGMPHRKFIFFNIPVVCFSLFTCFKTDGSKMRTPKLDCKQTILTNRHPLVGH